MFKDVPIGTKCTGTVHFFGLSAKELMAKNIIRKVGDRHTPPDYIFNGLRYFSHQEEPPSGVST